MKAIVSGRIAMLAIGVAGLALTAGCHSSAPDETVVNNSSTFVETVNAMTEANIVEPAPTPVANVTHAVSNTTTSEFSSEEQTQDDADATGMTARLPQDNGAEPAH